MTLEHDVTMSDDFGLVGTFPRPGWVVLDAARDRRFTGEVVFDTVPQVNVYLDRGSIYLAERVTDPSLGARLVDSGALNAAQLEHGAMRIGDDEHLGRLFGRVPSIDRHTVLVTAELMTEECVGWLAHQRVDQVESTPYRHHASGVHRWERSSGWSELNPGDPLPAPDPGQIPVEVSSPEPLFALEGEFTDDMITWDEPSWLAERSTGGVDEQLVEAPTEAPLQPSPNTAPEVIALPDVPPAEPNAVAEPAIHAGDWVDRLESDGLPEAGSDPLAAATTLPPLPVEPADRFEVIWPSGEIDEQFGGTDVATVADHHPDLDRAGPTARVMRAASPADDAFPAGPGAQPEVEPERGSAEAPMTDDVVLAVRRAVASIETGALATRRPLESERDDVGADVGNDVGGDQLGRTSLRRDGSDWALGVAPPPVRSVFDDIPIAASPPVPEAEPSPSPVELPPAAPEVPVVESPPEPERTSALRRLIGSLRRR